MEETDVADFFSYLLLRDEPSPRPRLAWTAHPTCWRAGLCRLQADEVERLWWGQCSVAEKMNENSSMFPCQPECLLRMTQSLASSLLGAADPTLSTENVLWTHALSEWLGWPHPLKTGKNKTSNVTRHNMHLPCFLLKKKN